MAIAFDTSGSGTGANSASVSLTAAAANEVAIIVVDLLSTDTIGTPTVGGSSTGVTQIGSDFTNSGQTVRFYYLVNPPTTSSAYAVSGATDGIQIYVELFSGASTTSPIDSNNTGTSATTNITLSTTVVASNCWLMSFFRCFGSGINDNAGGAGTTLRQTIASSSIGDSNATVGTGSQSMSWTGGRQTSHGFIISIAPPSVATANIPTLLTLNVG